MNRRKSECRVRVYSYSAERQGGRPKVKKLFLSILLLTICASCTPLRKMQRTQTVDSTMVDRTEIRKIISEAIKEQGTLVQTVTEYYPQIIYIRDTVHSGKAEDRVVVLPPTVKRTIKTEVATNIDKVTKVDSMAKNDVEINVQSDTSEKVVEKPPSSVMTIKWIAIGLVALLLIIVALKFRWR